VIAPVREGTSPYDLFAWFYDRYWALPHHEWQAPVLENLLFSRLPSRARILDLCCGSGHLAQELLGRGYSTIGLDSSREMLRLAREKAPQAQFLEADAADFLLEQPVDAVVCLFDSLNHVLEAGHLQRVFHNVHAVLKDGGIFVFDVNDGAAYGERWGYSSIEIQPDHAFILRGRFDPAARIGATEITMFRLLGSWQRSDALIRQRPWERCEITAMLESAGFTAVVSRRAVEELGIDGHYGIGRVFFQAIKSLVAT
jgi:SAM-dependent methyltransferase